MPAGDRSDHFVPRVAYSTGLLLGRVLVEIIADLIGAYLHKGNRMSTAKADVLELLDELPADCTAEEIEYVLHVRNKIRRGDADYEAGRTLTHEEFEARMAPWLAG